MEGGPPPTHPPLPPPPMPSPPRTASSPTDVLTTSLSWPAAEDALDLEWTSIPYARSPLSSFSASALSADDWARASLVQTNRLLMNQVEVLSALAGRPCSGVAVGCAVRLQAALRRRRARRAFAAARAAACAVQRHARGRAARVRLAAWRGAACAVQAWQRVRLARAAAAASRREAAGARLRVAWREYAARLRTGPTKTWLRRQVLLAVAARRELEAKLARHQETLGDVVAAHSAAAARARAAEAAQAEAAAKHAAEMHELLHTSFDANPSHETRVARSNQDDEKEALKDEVNRLLVQLSELQAEKLSLQDQASELLVEKLQGWI